ncbi:MAG: diguanylate cyclase [Nitrospirae bacterium]|nr:diguanylate cyclase [Nitrospirota bacterium]
MDHPAPPYPDDAERTKRRERLKAFLAFFLGAALLLGAVSAMVYFPEVEKERELLQAAQSLLVSRQGEAIEGEVRRVVSDLMILATNEQLYRLAEHDTLENRFQVARAFMAFSGFKGVFDQVRFIDNDGVEVVRVNNVDGFPERVPDDALQNKSHRYYFSDILRLNENEVYISPLDLNVEDGGIEQPINPTIRFATPMYDDHGVRHGVVMVNYRGRILLDRLAAGDDTGGRLMLVNAEGYFLKGPDAGDEWGFMIPDRAQRTIGNVFGKAGEAILRQESGQFSGLDGLFTFTTVHPVTEGIMTSLRGAPRSADLAGADAYTWKLVSHVPTSRLHRAATELRKLIWNVNAPLLMVFAAVSWLLANARMKRLLAEARLRESELRFRSVTQAASDAIISTDGAGAITSWNRGAERIFGYGEAEALGQDTAMLVPEPLRSRHVDAMARLGRGGAPSMLGKVVELEGLRKDGATFPLDISLARWEANGRTCYSGIIRDITERKRMERELERLAITDGLTQLHNRAHLDARLREECARANRHGIALALMILDIDHFKSVNDTHGHQAGDACLSALARAILAIVRTSDIAARYGGEEFAIVMPHTDADGALTLAERLRAAAEGLEVPVDGGATIRRTLSIGVAQLDPFGRMTPEDLIRAADQALYAAKEAGRNRVMLAGHAPEVHA